MTRFVEMVLSPDNNAFRARLRAVRAQRRGALRRSTTRSRSSRSRSARRACPISTRAPSCGTSASSIRTIAVPSITGSAATLLGELPDAIAPVDPSIAGESCCSIPRMIVSSCSRQRPCFARGARRTTCFADGAYEPLAVEGNRRDHVFAFARVLGNARRIVAVPRLVATLEPDGDAPLGERSGATRGSRCRTCAALLPAGVHRASARW